VNYDILAEMELFKLLDIPDMILFPNSLIQLMCTMMGVKNYLVQQFMVTLSDKKR
jgi:hypothetical protein